MRKIPCMGTLVFTEMGTYDVYAIYELDDEIMVTSEDEDFYVERARVEHIWLVRGILFGKGTY